MSEQTSSFLYRAEQLLDVRRAAISGLETAAAKQTAAEAAKAAADQEMQQAIEAAKRAGWTTNELRQLGLPVDAPRRSKSGSRGARRTSRVSAAATLGAASSTT
ncbi:hypothetical protein SAMN05428985_11523 [Nocardioides sp. YR527]|uniref:hypothetical protein n=1 Tax=Nocardioides sp. YR527 TaxID=1881028 RepID=UPI000889E776|nr:hypothetical protein [Nocardioides sp. YR527]SDL33952.1 hypothetical protein SAMN05428985_11523 [Nocardioides sp. YR527]